MSLSPGTHVGPYEILSILGAGGMGEVYRARDAKLNRDVALKILPDAFAGDSDRLARFTREAQTLASLNHPNIAHIHGLEESGAVRGLVMELVEGEDLSQWIARGAIRLDEALPIARQIAEALEAAHEQGIVHRDLKPANVKVRPDGMVKVLDFGLAKAIDASASGAGGSAPRSVSPTITSPAMMTQMGIIIGTAAYMAPEQAKGKPVDKRVDVWAFGLVLCEMLTGQPMYAGETVPETLVGVLMKEPDLSTLPAAVPPAIRYLIARCLQKDPRLRLRDIGEARILLQSPATFAGGQGAITDGTLPSPSSTRWLATAAIVLGLLLAVATWRWWDASTKIEPRHLIRFDIRPPDKTALATVARPGITISPDGSALAFVGVSDGIARLYVRRRDEFDARPVPGTDGAANPVFSPDGTEIAFFGSSQLKKANLDSSVTTIVSRTASDPIDTRGLAWLDDGTIVYSPDATSPLFRVEATGGSARPVTTLDEKAGERTHRWPAALPGSKAVLFTVGTVASPDNYDSSNIEAVVLATGERRVVVQGARAARYAPTGHLLFARGPAVFAVGFDVQRLATRGSPVRVLDGVGGDVTTGATHLDLAAADGTLAYVPGNAQGEGQHLVWVDRQGRTEPVDVPPGAICSDPRLSPDGTRAALVWEQVGGASPEVWLTDVSRKTFTRFSFDGNAATPQWTSDGQTIYYMVLDPNGRKSTIMRRPADGSRDAEPVVVLDSRAYLAGISPQNDTALIDFGKLAAKRGKTDVMKVALTRDAKPVALVASPFDEFASAWSPDGRWLAYQSDETGRFEVYVRDISGRGGRWQVSTAGGEEPHWSVDGKELYYRSDTRLMVVTVTPGAMFQPGAPAALFDGVYNQRTESGISYAVDPKAGRFLMVRLASGDAAPNSVRVVLNWLDELRRKTQER